MTQNEIIASLMAKGAKMERNIIINNVTVTDMGEYTRLGLTIDTEVDSYNLNKTTSVYEKGKSNIIFSSTYSMNAILKLNEDAAFITNKLVQDPDMMAIVVNKAKVDVIQVEVAAGEEVKNPFSSNDDARIYDHDTIINYVVNIRLGEEAKKMLERVKEKLADKMAEKLLGL